LATLDHVESQYHSVPPLRKLLNASRHGVFHSPLQQPPLLTLSSAMRIPIRLWFRWTHTGCIALYDWIKVLD